MTDIKDPKLLAFFLLVMPQIPTLASSSVSCFWFLGVFFLFVCFFFLGMHLQHMEVSRLGLESEIQLPATATATCICDLHHSSQHWILNPLSEARDRAHILMDISWVRNHRAATGTPLLQF